MSFKDELKKDIWLIVLLSVVLSLQFLHLAAIDNRVSELELLHSSAYCSECGKLK